MHYNNMHNKDVKYFNYTHYIRRNNVIDKANLIDDKMVDLFELKTTGKKTLNTN